MLKNDKKTADKKTAFEQFYNLNYNKVYRHIVKKIGNLHDAEDIASEVFIYCYRHFESYDPNKASLGTWLYLVTNSRIKNYYRDKKQGISIESLDESLEDVDAGPEELAEFEHCREWLAEALKSLPEQSRRVVILKYFYGLSANEIASETGITSSYVRTMLSRALDKLEENYKKYLKKGDING